MNKTKSMTKHIVLHGKGGVGKTTLATNIAAALVEAGFKILLMGFDPKGDSSALLNNGHPFPDLLGQIRTKSKITLDSVVHSGFKGILCVEAGNPFQAGTHASLELARALEEIQRIKLFENVAADYVIHDVSGDGSSAEPLEAIRQWGLDRLFVVTSADFMSLRVSNSIFSFMERYGDNHVPIPMGGLIPNNITSSFEESFISNFAADTNTRTLGGIPRSLLVRQCELYGKTIIEAAPFSNQAYFYRRLANQLVDAVRSGKESILPQPMQPERLRKWAREWGDRIHALENGLVSDGAAI